MSLGLVAVAAWKLGSRRSLRASIVDRPDA
jgi:hypothetical protein